MNIYMFQILTQTVHWGLLVCNLDTLFWLLQHRLIQFAVNKHIQSHQRSIDISFTYNMVYGHHKRLAANDQSPLELLSIYRNKTCTQAHTKHNDIHMDGWERGRTEDLGGYSRGRQGDLLPFCLVGQTVCVSVCVCVCMCMCVCMCVCVCVCVCVWDKLWHEEGTSASSLQYHVWNTGFLHENRAGKGVGERMGFSHHACDRTGAITYVWISSTFVILETQTPYRKAWNGKWMSIWPLSISFYFLKHFVRIKFATWNQCAISVVPVSIFLPFTKLLWIQVVDLHIFLKL